MSSATKDKNETKLIRELKKQIQMLKRENGQLKKKNARIETEYALAQSEQEFNEVYEPIVEKKDQPKLRCPKCGAYETMRFMLKEVPYYKCLSCEAKGKIK